MSGASYLVAGLILAGLGGELFVRGLVGIARWLRVAPAIVALTLAAFATSGAELSVAVNAAVEGRPLIGLGNAVGGNVVNFGLVLAVALTMAPVQAGRGAARRDFPVAMVAPALTVLLMLDGTLSRLDGVLLTGLFATWLAFTLAEAWTQRGTVEYEVGEKRGGRAVAASLVGLLLLVVAGRVIVIGGVRLGEIFGLDPFLVGALVVAIGTSMPELATTLVARWRGHSEVAIGTLLGSNVFNGLFIVGVVALVHPTAIEPVEVAVGLGFGALLVAAAYPVAGVIGRRRSVALFALYAAYVMALGQGGLR